MLLTFELFPPISLLKTSKRLDLELPLAGATFDSSGADLPLSAGDFDLIGDLLFETVFLGAGVGSVLATIAAFAGITTSEFASLFISI